MRLTLRTMLAYLDDCLDTAEAEELGKKIQESEFANGLVHRIRNSMRKLRLAAPKMEGKGLGLDPNTVAEYLETTLSPETVPDFEKVCLESDVHLAEIASCHQILALVLKEPANVSPALRERMYRVGHGTEPAKAESPAEAPALSQSPSPAPAQPPTPPASQPPSMLASTPPDIPQAKKPPLPVPPAAATQTEQPPQEETTVARGKPELPDYLKAGEKRYVPLVVTAVIVFLVLSVAFFAIGPNRIASWFGGGDETAGPVAQGPDQPASPPDQANPRNTATDSPAQDKDSQNGPPPDNTDLATDVDSSATADIPLPGDTTTDKAPDGSMTPPMPPDIPGVVSDPEPEPDNGDPMPKDTTGDEPVVVPPEPETKEPEPEAPVDMGFFTSEQQVLARLDRADDAFYRMATNSRVSSGDRLIVPPTYRPQLTFASGIQATLIGPAQLKLDVAKEEGIPRLEVDYGPAVLNTIGKSGAQISLNLAGKQGVATFMTVDSSLAIEVRYYRPPGADPEAQPANLMVHLVALRGGIVWRHDDGEVTLGQNGVALHFDDQAVRTGTLKEPPSWIEAPKLGRSGATAAETNIQGFASLPVERLIDQRRAMLVPLEEIMANSRAEVRALAAHALSQLDSHEALFTQLADQANKAFWEYGFDVAQEALARSPQAAAELRMALEKLRGADGRKLYRLLWGYSPDQLADSTVTTELVNYLEHESMDFRVLASINLRRITGRTHLYRPEFSRASAVKSWRDDLASGKIVYEELPTPPTLLSLAAPAAEPE